MLFNSYPFLLLVVLTFLLYYLPALKKYQVYVLILSSFTFYAYHKPILLLLLIVSAGINSLTSYWVVHNPFLNRKWIASIGVVSNLFILAFFKDSPLVFNNFFCKKSGHRRISAFNSFTHRHIFLYFSGDKFIG